MIFKICRKETIELVSFVRARSASNKMEVFDNRAFAIEVKLEPTGGFKAYFIDLLGEREARTLFYKDRRTFDEEWEIVDMKYEILRKYDVKNYYME